MSIAHDRAFAEIPCFGIAVSARLEQLAREIIEAGKLDDRERYERLFDLAFGIAYGAAWRMTGDVAEAQRLAARRLVRAIRAGLATSSDPVLLAVARVATRPN